MNLRSVLFRLLGAFQRRELERELDNEIAAHLEQSEQDDILAGMTGEEARLAARRSFGGVERVKDECRDRWSLFWLETLWRDLGYALRAVLRHKCAYLTVSAILALGIGMSVAMFSLVDAVLLRPLPFPRQESIHVIWKVDPLAGDHVEELAYPELLDLQESSLGFEYVAVMPTSLYGYARVLQTGKAEPVYLESAPVSHDFFRVLGVSPVLGRDFTSSDERVGAPPVVVVSDRVWRNQLGADRDIVGRMIRLNGQGHTVIGVMAPGVEFPRGAALWVPLARISNLISASRPCSGLQRLYL